MDNPKTEKPYVFARVNAAGEIESTTFVRHADGSAGFVAEGFLHVHEGDPAAWREALAVLAQLGFKEMREAKAAGWLPHDWQPADVA